MEPLILSTQEGEEKVIFYSATPPKNTDKAVVIQALPMDVKYDFKVGPKPSTVYALQVYVSSVNGTLGGLMSNKDDLKIYLPAESDIRPIEEIVYEINEVLLIDEFFGKWTINVGDDERKYTLAGVRTMRTFSLKTERHDFRDRPIGSEDLMDLKIMLETMDVNTFISSI
jgi:hypothetical protein